MRKRVSRHKTGSARMKKERALAQAKQRKTASRETVDLSSAGTAIKGKRAFTKYRPVSASTFIRQRSESFETAMGSVAGAVRGGRG